MIESQRSDRKGLASYILLHFSPCTARPHVIEMIPEHRELCKICTMHKGVGKRAKPTPLSQDVRKDGTNVCELLTLGFCLHLLGPKSLGAEIVYIALSWMQTA